MCLRVEFLFFYSPLVLLKVSPLGFQKLLFCRLIFQMQGPQNGESDVGAQTPHSLGRIVAVVIVLPLVDHHSKAMNLDLTGFSPTYLPHCSSLFIFLFVEDLFC